MQEDPFGLDALLASSTKRVEKRKEKKDAMVRVKKAENENKRRSMPTKRSAFVMQLEEVGIDDSLRNVTCTF
ncbi:hypothetical protein EJ110_NYTH34665 [Nymphaea thermarum]|nr:hypothetical protein EJ110_NYTH34665 [Nymphaea thermarum]